MKRFGPAISLLRRLTIRLGIDLGGTKIEILVINDDGEALLGKRIATPKSNYQEIIDAIASLVFAAEQELQQTYTIGVCTPGSLSPASGLLRNSNTVCLNKQPFKKLMQIVLPYLRQLMVQQKRQILYLE